jgi:hypothetical protein
VERFVLAPTISVKAHLLHEDRYGVKVCLATTNPEELIKYRRDQ